MPSPSDLIRVTSEPLEAGELMAAVRQDSSGAVASFVGVVRDHHRGQRVDHLVYEAYPPMAEQELRRIADEAHQRWRVDRIALAHRTGRLDVGEVSVIVVVAAPHRREALEACSFCIETIKQKVPIWKKQYGDAGGEWIIGDSSAG